MEQQDISSFVSFFQDFYKLQYADKINELLVNYPDKRSLQLDYRELERFDPEMADKLIKMPEKLIKAAEEALLEKKPALPGGLEFKPNVRFFGLPADTMLIQHLSSSNLNEMVAFKGVVTKRAEVMHRVKKAAYHCDLCGHDESYYVTKDFRQPKKCSECKKLALVQVDDKSEFVDIQRAEIQELLERVRGGAPAAHVELLFEDDAVNQIAPGDNVEIAGIMRLKQPMKPRQKQEMVYGRYIEINSVLSMKKDFEEIEISKEDEERIRELAKDPRISEYIIKSVAPAIYGHEEVKKALTLQLFGGTRGKVMKGGASIRDDIHILLIGDPGIAKSRFLLSVNDLAPKSIYVSGKSVSGAGLTVSAEKDELGEGGWTLKAGAVVLASGGIVEVDEFDKVSEDDRAALHEAMETQSYHYKTKIMLSDGREIAIGELVESRMAKHKDKLIQGKNCIVLRDGIDDIRLLTTDFEKITETTPFQISKHTAPEYYVKILLQTGRELLVTPEHPIWVLEDGKVTTKEAEKLTENDYTFMPRQLPLRVSKPEINPEFFKFVGYHITDGGYELNRGKKNGVNFYNKDNDLIEDYEETAKTIFNVSPYVRTNPASGVTAVRLISMPVLNKLLALHAPLIGRGSEKTIPPEMLSAPKEQIGGLLRAVFDSDGSFSRGHISLVGENQEFINQVQLLLLRFGIRSHTFKDGKVFRLTITGSENLEKYSAQVSFLSKKKKQRLEQYIKSKRAYRNATDVIPNCDKQVFGLLKELKIPEISIFGYGLHMQKKGYCFTRRNFIEICSKMRKRLEYIRSSLKASNDYAYGDLIRIRTELDISQSDMAKLSEVKRATISYWETKKVSLEKYRPILQKTLSTKLSLGKELLGLEQLAYGDMGFVAIRKVEKVRNTNEKWVYDVTVEPNRTFISECTVLHNTISVAKAGIVAKFKSKTSILAAANPKYGRFDQSRNLAEQFDVPPTLLSRFDLIFPIVDVLDEEKDTKLAEHILATHRGEFESSETEGVVDKEMLRKYVSYARRHIVPKLSKEASDKIRDFYVTLRGKSRDAGAVAITPRYLEGLVRLAEANAKIKLSETVGVEDADAAISLLNYVMRQVMVDRETGMLDVDTITTGKPKSTRDKLQKFDTVLDIIREALRYEETVSTEKVLEEAEKAGVDRPTAERIVQELLRKGDIYEKEHGYLKMVGGK